ncbi:MAG: MFS transporter [Clostridia bacterium]|nr:MFS transporter [Clostridia bacterium]
MNKLGRNFWITLTVFSLVGQVAWVIENMYFNVFIYKMFAASPSDIAAMVTASAVAATVTTLLIGALSDKLGKRKIFISGGYILWGISIAAFALLRVDVISSVIPAVTSAASVGITFVIVLDCVMTFFGSSANDACFNAWLTDSTDQTNRGAAEGINAMMPLLAILVVFGSTLGMDNSDPRAWSVFFGIMGAVVVLIGILGFFIIKEPSLESASGENYFANIFYGFRPSVIKNNKTLYVSLGAFAIFGISIQIFMPYLILYYTEALKLDNYVFIMAPAVILAAVATLFYGRLYDKYGFLKTVLPALAALGVGYLLFCFFTNTVLVFVASLLMMCGYLCGMAVFGALIREYTPENKAGRFQGLRIVGQVLIPGIIGPFIGQKVLANAQKVIGSDGTEAFIPNQNIFVAALIAALVILPVLLPLARLMKKEKSQ